MASDSHLRSLLKAFSWRILATLTTATIAYVVTGKLDTAVIIGGIEFVIKFVITTCMSEYGSWFLKKN